MTKPQPKIKYKRGFKNWADKKSVELRVKLGLHASSPLCAYKLCEHLQVPIKEPKDIINLPEDSINELLGDGSDKWSAATVPLPNKKYWIIHNPTHSSARQQSNLMHEIAHILCNHQVSKEKLNLGLSGFLRNYNQDQENEAEWLGACLQLPRPALISSLKNDMSIEEIAEKYNASIEMTRYRINITGVKRQLAYMKR